MDTYGYDYSYAITKKKVNEIMQKNLSTVFMPLKYKDHDPVTGAITTIDVNLDVWSMAGGGQNSTLKLNVPIKEGFLSISGLPGVNGSWDMTNVNMLLEVKLGWMGDGDEQELDGEGALTKMVFSPVEIATPGDAGYLAITKVTDPTGQLTTAAVGMLKQIAQAAFFENRDNLQYIFAGVVPIPAGSVTWLRPHKWRYYVASGDIEALCFLCMLSDVAFPNDRAFDSTALKSGSNAVALISQDAFFRNTLLPAIETAFPGGSFSVSLQDQHSLISNSGSFDVKVDGNDINTNHFKLWPSNSGSGLQTSANGGGPLKFLFGWADLPGASYSWTVKTINPLQLDLSSGKMTFKDDPSPTLTHDQDIPWYDYILLAGMGLTLPGLIADIVDAVNGFGNKVNKVGISNINNAIQSSFNDNVVNVTNLLYWEADGESFTLTEGGLDGALFFRGNFS